MRSHEPGLYEHSLHVAKLATDYTRFCGLDLETSWNIIEGGLLHDVGKIQLPPALLVKPKALSGAEQRMMILHPKVGAGLLEAEGYYTKPVIAIVKRVITSGSTDLAIRKAYINREPRKACA